jgi:RNA polymerase sigma-70 factor, ECF subfamily
MPESDEILMQRVTQRRDEAAFRELMTRYQQRLMNHFMRRGVYEGYEDLALETFVKIYKARKRYRQGAAFKAWMFTIAQRVWIDHLRKSGRRKRREDAFKAEPVSPVSSPPRLHPRDADWALSQLGERHREVVVYAVYDQLSHKEISGILRIPEGTVKSRLHHGIKQLRDIFEQGELI